MTDDELATGILDLLSPGARTCEDLFQTWPECPAARVEATIERLVQAGLVIRGDHDPATPGVTDAGVELLVEAHTTAAMPATAIKAAVIGRALKERTEWASTRRRSTTADHGRLPRPAHAETASYGSNRCSTSGSEHMDEHDVSRVIAEYDAIVRKNTTPGYDALKAVAADGDGEVRCEVIETAERMGYPLDDDALTQLRDAADTYQKRLAAQLAADLPTAQTTSRSQPSEGTRVELLNATDQHTRLSP